MIALERVQDSTVAGTTLARNEAHVWWASLDASAAHVRRFAGLLSTDEARRGRSFHFERDQRRFVVGRGLLRTILGRYLGTDPRRLRFDYGRHGKPALAGELGVDGLRFNLAHSEDVAVFAVALGSEIGVDVECLRPVPDADRIAKDCFSARENAVYSAMGPGLRLRAFFDCWTRKEAFVKAIGDGLTHPLDTFDVSLAPDEPARLVQVHGDLQATARWSLQALDGGPHCAAALVVDGQGSRLVSRAWRLDGSRGAEDRR